LHLLSTRAVRLDVLAVNTTLRKSELLKLRWKDVDLIERVLYVHSGKTDQSVREIPLSDEAFNVIFKLREHAKLLFGETVHPDSFVMFWWPGTGKPDNMRQAKGLGRRGHQWFEKPESAAFDSTI
jgi:integrase